MCSTTTAPVTPRITDGPPNQSTMKGDLLQFTQIATVVNGSLKIHSENLQSIVNAIDSSKFPDDTPATVIATTTGRADVTEWFLPHCLINFLKNADTGGDGEAKRFEKNWKEFEMAAFSRKDDYSCDYEYADAQGVYLWPEPFYLENMEVEDTKPSRMGVWVMHVNFMKSEADTQELKKFIGAVCSRIFKMEYNSNGDLEPVAFQTSHSIDVGAEGSFLNNYSFKEFCYVELTTDGSTESQSLDSGYTSNEEGPDRQTMKNTYTLLKRMVQTKTLFEAHKWSNSKMRMDNIYEYMVSAAQRAHAQRLQQEKDFFVKEKCVISCISEITERSIKYDMEFWIRNHLSPATVGDLEYIFDHTLSAATQPYHVAVHPSLWKEFMTRVDFHSRGPCEEILTDVTGFLVKFNTKLVKEFHWKEYLSAATLSQLVYEEILKVKEEMTPGFTLDMVTLGLEKLGSIYKEKSEQVVQTERDNFFNEMALILGEVFLEGLKKYLSTFPYDAKALQNIQKDVLAKMRREIEDSLEPPREVTTIIEKTKVPEDDNLMTGYQDKKDTFCGHKELEELACNGLENAAAEIIEKYGEQMDLLLKEGNSFPYDVFKSLHDQIEGELIISFKSACLEAKLKEEVTLRKVERLKVELWAKYRIYKEANRNRRAKRFQDTKKIVEQHVTEYAEKMEDVLQRNPNGLSEADLAEQHDVIQVEVLKLLKEKILNKMGFDEPTEKHEKSWQHQVDTHWQAVVFQNEENLRKGNKVPEPEPEKQEEEVSPELPDFIHSFLNKSDTDQTFNNISCGSSSVSPLIFHLQSQKVAMAMEVDGKVEIVRNEFNQFKTPAYVAQMPNGELDYGLRAFSQVNSAGPGTSTQFHWSLADFFVTNDFSWSKSLQIRGREQIITTEFLLGYLLRKLKMAAEQRENVRCATAVLAIPFWLSSVQRSVLKDGAEVAGFSKVYLVNEASAVAYNYYNPAASSSPPTRPFLLINESMDRVDVFVYSFDKDTVTMMGHAEDYNNGGEDFDKNKAAGHQIRQIFKKAIAEANLRPGGECLFLTDDYNKRGKSLINLAMNFGRNPTQIDLRMAVLRGAVMLARAPNLIKTRIQDKMGFEVVQTTPAGDIVAVPKGARLPTSSQQHSVVIGGDSAEKVSFYQNAVGLGTRHHIGDLLLKEINEPCPPMEPVLEVNHEAIVTVKMKTVVSTEAPNGFPNTLSDNWNVQARNMTWKTWNLPRGQVREITCTLGRLVKSFCAHKKTPSPMQSKQDLQEDKTEGEEEEVES